MGHIIMITGGQRSGKSRYAERLALQFDNHPVYMGTAHVWDDEFRLRVERHQARRGPQWTNIEEEKHLSRHDLTGRVVVVDCITLWCTNFFFNRGRAEWEQPSVDEALTEVQAEFDRLTKQDATFIFVTNEIGSGGVSDNAIQRRFTDLEGWMNQYVAARADEVVLMVSGIPVRIKGDGATETAPATTGHEEMVGDDEALRRAIQQKIDNLNKPKGSLGRLESLAMQLCMIQRTLSPTLRRPHHLLFGSDHGIEREGVSVSPREITWQQMINFTRGGGGVNMFCRQHGFELRIIDVGVDHDLSAWPEIIDRKISNGTANFLHGAAMTERQYRRALDVGREQVDICAAEGCNVICIGEMGIANTSPSSVWMSLMGGIPLDECIGAGAGLDTPGIQHKREVLAKAVENFNREHPDCMAKGGYDTIIRHFGGFEMVAAIGAMLRAAELDIIILVDGFIMSACALAASQLRPEVLRCMVFGHCGDESGHRRLLDLMHAEPLLSLNLRLGEGTGALCAYPIVESAVRMMNEMNNFKDANITKYF